MKMNKKIVVAAAASAAVTAMMASLPTQAAGLDPESKWGSGSYVGARFYQYDDFKGAELKAMITKSSCTSSHDDVQRSHDRLSDLDWNDLISVVRTYRGCEVKLYEHTNFNKGTSGAATGWVAYGENPKPLTASMNNKASSVKVS